MEWTDASPRSPVPDRSLHPAVYAEPELRGHELSQCLHTVVGDRSRLEQEPGQAQLTGQGLGRFSLVRLRRTLEERDRPLFLVGRLLSITVGKTINSACSFEGNLAS